MSAAKTDIDQDIAKAYEKLDKASNEIEVAKVEKKIARLKRRERLQIYWLYVTTWVLPLLMASLLLLFGTSQ